MKPEQDVYFLGGRDLEMETIAGLLREQGFSEVAEMPAGVPVAQLFPEDARLFFNFHLAWGARASAYETAIHACLAQQKRPVLVELSDDLQLGERELLIDHHGALAGADQPTALHQVFQRLGLPASQWTRHFELVAANDRGYIPAMQAAGATQEEIRRIRAADRQSQGITTAEEMVAQDALAHLKLKADGRLTVAHLPHNRTAALCDRLEVALGGPGYENLLVFCPAEINFFGAGHLIQTLIDHFSGGWWGSSLEQTVSGTIRSGYGFWGMATTDGMGNENQLIALLVGKIKKSAPAATQR